LRGVRIDDYVRSKKILLDVSLNEGSIESVEPSSTMEWFALSKFLREKVRKHQNDPDKLRFYVPHAVNAFLMSNNPYMAGRLVEFLAMTSCRFGRYDVFEESLDLVKKLPEPIRRDLEYSLTRMLFHWDPEEGLREMDRLLSLGPPKSIDLLQVFEIILGMLADRYGGYLVRFLDIVRGHYEELYFELLGEAVMEERLRGYLDHRIVEDVISNAPPVHKLLFLRGTLKRGMSKDIVSSIMPEIIKMEDPQLLKLLARILITSIREEMLDDEVMGYIESLIRELYAHGLYYEVTNLASRYATSLIGKDQARSLVFLDVSINTCYAMGDPLSIPLIYGDYLSSLLQKGLPDIARKVLGRIYSEDKIVGLRNIHIWLPVYRSIKSEDDLRAFRKIADQITSLLDHGGRKIVSGFLALARLKFSGRGERTILQEIIDLGLAYFIVRAIGILGNIGRLDDILWTVDNSIKALRSVRDIGEVLYAAGVTLADNGEYGKIEVLLDMIRRSYVGEYHDIVGGILMELATYIIDSNEDIGCRLLVEAHKRFEKSGMYWMSLNALAIYAAHRPLAGIV